MARLWGKKRQATETAAAEEGEGSRKQTGVKQGRERRTGWVEMEGMLFSLGRKSQRSVAKRGNGAKVTVNSRGLSSKQVQKPPDKHMQQARLEGQASPGACPRQGLLPKAVGFLFDLIPAKIHLQRGLRPGGTAWSPGGYTRRSCTILQGFNLGRNRTTLHPENTAWCLQHLPGDTYCPLS